MTTAAKSTGSWGWPELENQPSHTPSAKSSTTFFCSRASTNTNNARLIIAHELASASPSIKSKVVEAIEEDDTLPESTYSKLEVQFNKLIRDPLQASIGRDARTYKVVVIDAVDECTNGMLWREYCNC
jgi:hypothetical protein